MTSEAFVAALDLFQDARTDYDRAMADFEWPTLNSDFNWARDYFDVIAEGNEACDDADVYPLMGFEVFTDHGQRWRRVVVAGHLHVESSTIQRHELKRRRQVSRRAHSH